MISTITEGELLGLARYWRWGSSKILRLRDILSELVRVEVGHPDIVEAYAEIYAEGKKHGQPPGENDLWIAATAKATGAMLITCDKHFDWLHNTHITRLYVEESPAP